MYIYYMYFYITLCNCCLWMYTLFDHRSDLSEGVRRSALISASTWKVFLNTLHEMNWWVLSFSVITKINLLLELHSTRIKLLTFFCIKFKVFHQIAVYNEVIVIRIWDQILNNIGACEVVVYGPIFEGLQGNNRELH